MIDSDEDVCFEEIILAEKYNNTVFSVGDYIIVNLEGGVNLFQGKSSRKRIVVTLFLLWSGQKRDGKDHDSHFYDAANTHLNK